ncbi:MAG: hypothetical protein IAE89_04980 [Anaerolineae bacterium]|nr:hypothetical protein [Anaerolineae bacterium]
MLPDRESRRAAAYENAPLEDLLTVILRQWKRPLAAHQLQFTDAGAAQMAAAIVRREPDPRLPALSTALQSLVAESEALLAGWNLTFAQSLDAEMSAIPDWESTAEFLETAERKTNAELRISTGAALLVAIGEKAYAPFLAALVERGVIDLDSAIARRVLLFASGVDSNNSDWLEAVKQWYTK